MSTLVKFDSPPRRNSDVGAATLADLHDLRGRNQTQRFEHVELVDRLERRLVDHGHRRAGSRLQLLGCAGSDHDILLQRANLERHLDDDAAALTEEHGLARLRLEAGHARLHLIAIGRQARERKRSVAAALAVLDLLSFTEQRDGRPGQACAQRVDDGAAQHGLRLRCALRLCGDHHRHDHQHLLDDAPH